MSNVIKTRPLRMLNFKPDNFFLPAQAGRKNIVIC
jgi:hypothetical protein